MCPETTFHNAEGTPLTKTNLQKISNVIHCELNLRAMPSDALHRSSV